MHVHTFLSVFHPPGKPELGFEGRGVLGRGARVQSPPQAGHARAGGHPGVGILTLHGELVAVRSVAPVYLFTCEPCFRIKATTI